jgi:two-component system, chemotaxis family, sensor kinase CheA
MDVDEFKEIFAEEAITHLTAFERGILALEKDPKATEAINDIFRAVHTLKGASGMVGLGATSRFSHAAESFLDGVRAGTQGLDRDRVSTLLAVHDALKLLIEKEISGNIGAALEGEVARLTEWLKAQGSGDAAPVAAVAERKIQTGQLTRFFIHIECNPRMAQNGFDPLSFIRYLKNAGSLLDCRVLPGFPDAGAFDPELLYLGFEVLLETEKSTEEIREIFSLAGDLVKVTVGEEKRVAARHQEPAAKQQAAESDAQKKNYLRVESGRLDALIDSIGELVMTGAALRSLQPKGADERYLDQMTLLERQVETMRDTAMSLRTFSLSEVFRRF